MRRLAVLALLLVGCAPMPKDDVPTVEDCESRRRQCILCVDTATGEGDWYYQIDRCPDGKYRVDLRRK